MLASVGSEKRDDLRLCVVPFHHYIDGSRLGIVENGFSPHQDIPKVRGNNASHSIFNPITGPTVF
jgi:hypothetical protein